MSTETFSLFESKELRDLGMAAAAESRHPMIQKVRAYLRGLARDRVNRCVTADDAYKYLDSIGEECGALGNAARSYVPRARVGIYGMLDAQHPGIKPRTDVARVAIERRSRDRLNESQPVSNGSTKGTGNHETRNSSHAKDHA
jgi:hypothetical protein